MLSEALIEALKKIHIIEDEALTQISTMLRKIELNKKQ